MDKKLWYKLFHENKLNEDFMRTIFPSKVIKKIAKLTDFNNHNEARLTIAKQLNDKKLINAFEEIGEKQEKIGHLPDDLSKEQDKFTKQMLKQVKAKYINSNDVYGAL